MIPFTLFATSALKPEPIECNTKVIMIGDTHIFTTFFTI